MLPINTVGHTAYQSLPI